MKSLSDTLKKTENINDTLNESYEKALQNPTFYDFVTMLSLPKKELIKYTSTLEECASEYEHCKNCKNILECKNSIIGYAYLPSVAKDHMNFEYQACKYQKNIEKQQAYQKNMELFEIGEELRNASMKDIDIKDPSRYPTIKWIQNFIKNYKKNPYQKGLYLHGNFGAGKSYLIVAMFSELARQNIKSAIVFWPEFLKDLKASFGHDFKEKYETVKKAPLLLIDDIGAEATTEWGRDEIFCPLIQYRMDEKLPTFFTSNLDLKLLEEHFSLSKNGINELKAKRIISRIIQLTDQIEMISDNRRK